MNGMNGKKKRSWGRVLGLMLALVMLAVVVYGAVYGWLRCGDYARVYQNPVYAEAVVSMHDEHEDSEGDVTHYSYITYTVNGVTYERVSYESESTASRLTPLGTRLSVALNPEDPGELLEKVASPVMTLFFSAIVLALLVSQLQNHRSRALREVSDGRPDREKIAKHLRILIAGRFLRVFWMGLTVLVAVLCGKFPMLFGSGYVTLGAVTGCFWFWCLLTALRDGNRVRKGEFTVTWDRLVSKEIQEDDESANYLLFYVSQRQPDKVWSRTVSQPEYESAREGSVLQSVYLPGDKKPRLTYGAGTQVTP